MTIVMIGGVGSLPGALLGDGLLGPPGAPAPRRSPHAARWPGGAARPGAGPARSVSGEGGGPGAGRVRSGTGHLEDRHLGSSDYGEGQHVRILVDRSLRKAAPADPRSHRPVPRERHAGRARYRSHPRRVRGPAFPGYRVAAEARAVFLLRAMDVPPIRGEGGRRVGHRVDSPRVRDPPDRYSRRVARPPRHHRHRRALVAAAHAVLDLLERSESPRHLPVQRITG